MTSLTYTEKNLRCHNNGEEMIIKPPYLLRKYDVTIEEFEAITDEDASVEFFDGVMVMHSPASIVHEDVFAFLLSLMRGYVRHKQLGQVLGSRAQIHLASTRRFEPDLIFVRQDRLHIIQKTYIAGRPDLVVEILSPATYDYDLREKRSVYRESGIPEIWFVDPSSQFVLVDRKQEGEYQEERISTGRVKSSAIEGFWLKVEWLFGEMLPDEFKVLQEIINS
jgi:Uma2 family endonuclease